MINQLALQQARAMLRQNVNESPTVIIIYRDVMVDDGFGGMVVDPFHVGDPVSIVCRISHEQKSPEATAITSIGLSTALSRFILVPYDVTINEHEIFEALGKRWRIGPVDALTKFEGVIGYQAPLYEAAEIGEAAT